MTAKVTFIIAVLATLSFSSFKAITPVAVTPNTLTTTPAYDSGKGFGTAVKALYTQYKLTRKVDVNNSATLLNLASIATYGAAVKGSSTGTSTYKDFASGAIAGSSTLLGLGSVDNVIKAFTSMDLSSVVTASKNKTSVPATTSATISNAVINALNLIKK